MKKEIELWKGIVSCVLIVALMFCTPSEALAQALSNRSNVLENGTQIVLRVNENFKADNKADTGTINQFTMSATPPENIKVIDLGLPSGTLWANMNLGAGSITEIGGYYAWGEINPKIDLIFSEENYKFFRIEEDSYTNEEGFVETVTYKGYTKYVPRVASETEGFRGFYDDKLQLDPDDDAAFLEWGYEWEIPTVQQCEELEKYCSWEKIKMNGVSGYKIIGPNGNYIFLPAGGYCSTGWIQNKIGEYACYWTSSSTPYNTESYSMDWTGSPNNGVAQCRYIGRLIRPVQKLKSGTSIPQISDNLNKPSYRYYNIYGQEVDVENYKGQIIIKTDGITTTKILNH